MYDRDRAQRGHAGIDDTQMRKPAEDWNLNEVSKWLIYCDLQEAVVFFLKFGMDGLCCSGLAAEYRSGQTDIFVDLIKECLPDCCPIINNRLMTAMLCIDDLSNSWQWKQSVQGVSDG